MMMKSLLVLSLLVTPTAFAQEAPAPGCKGLPSPVDTKQLESNIAMRKPQWTQLCGGEGVHAKRLNVIEDRLKACKTLGKDLQGNTHSIPVETVLGMLKRRKDQVCKGYEDNIIKMGALCSAYGATAKKAEGIAPRVQDAQNGTGGEAAPFRALATEFGALSREYNGHRAASAAEERRLATKLGDISTDGRDDELQKNIGLLKFQIQSFAKYMEGQAKLTSAKREAHAYAANPDGSGAMRWKTRADVNNFWINLDKCKRAVKDGGELDKYKEDIDATLGKALKDARAEAGDIAKHLDEKSKEAIRAQAENDSRAGRINTAADEARGGKPDPVTGDRSAPGPMNQAYSAGLATDRDYASLAKEASTCGLGRNDCYRLDGYDLGNNNSQCFKKGYEPRVCFQKP